MTVSHRSPLADWPFLALMAFRIGITLSYQIVTVAVGWHVFSLTNNVLSLGWVGLAEVVPYFATALLAGHYVDTYSRQKLTLLAAVIHTLLAAGIALFTHTPHSWTVAFLYGAVGVGGLSRAFVRPLYQALMASVLPRELYARGSAVSATAFQACLVLGPAASGLVIAGLGVTAAYGLAAALAALSLLACCFMKTVYDLPQATPAPVLSSIREGLKFVFGHNIILAALSLDMFAVLFGGAVSILPAFIAEVLQGDPTMLGLLRAAPAIGSTVVGVALARFTVDRNAGAILLWCVAGFGVCIIGFGLSTSVHMAFACLLLSGAFDGVSVVVRSTILQLSTPDDMRGRVSAINGIFIGSSNELGAFESGMAASALGLVPSIVAGGVVTLLVVLVTDRKAPGLRRLNMGDLVGTHVRS
ncbi:MFS transporter [Limnobacter humi]|uniref:Multidrug efflux pump Tap n=1 Tax=Limnobacter humi TaxID=1778671 RepID=A0ABT1WI64_9BURK|nr:MFS transporter [Limnobacter humi]MCQ8896407.1 MFS transporter [Limnobacter humi]